MSAGVSTLFAIFEKIYFFFENKGAFPSQNAKENFSFTPQYIPFAAI